MNNRTKEKAKGIAYHEFFQKDEIKFKELNKKDIKVHFRAALIFAVSIFALIVIIKSKYLYKINVVMWVGVFICGISLIKPLRILLMYYYTHGDFNKKSSPKMLKLTKRVITFLDLILWIFHFLQKFPNLLGDYWEMKTVFKFFSLYIFKVFLFLWSLMVAATLLSNVWKSHNLMYGLVLVFFCYWFIEYFRCGLTSTLLTTNKRERYDYFCEEVILDKHLMTYVILATTIMGIIISSDAANTIDSAGKVELSYLITAAFFSALEHNSKIISRRRAKQTKLIEGIYEELSNFEKVIELNDKIYLKNFSKIPMSIDGYSMKVQMDTIGKTFYKVEEKYENLFCEAIEQSLILLKKEYQLHKDDEINRLKNDLNNSLIILGNYLYRSPFLLDLIVIGFKKIYSSLLKFRKFEILI